MISPEQYQRAVELFHEASALQAEEREAFLQRACGGDPEVLEEARSLLEHDEADQAASGIIEAGRGAELLAGDLFEEQADNGEDNRRQIPGRVGQYTVNRLIGHGGMGAVYEAEQENPRRRVALKMIRPGMAGPQLIKRLQREAQVLGRLQHPGIGQVYEAGFTDLGGVSQPYFAMELIDGLPLDAFAKQRGLCARARLELIARTCDAVHYAHERGVVHRDLKPGNICVVTEGSGRGVRPLACGTPGDCGEKLSCAGQPKVLDFGVARLTDADLHMATLQTEVGQLVGTLSYMSPEQIGGRSSAVDRRSDVYALGVILHELLTGEPPHDIREQTIPDAARIIRDEEPSRLGSINTQFRGDIETIVAKALEKDSNRRYQTAAAMAADIRRHLQDQPIRARPASNLYQLRKFARRHKTLVASVAVTLVVLLAGIAATSWLAFRETSARRVADRSAYRASLAAATSSLRGLDVATAKRHLDRAPPDLREWLWEHLDSSLDGSLETQEFHLARSRPIDRAESDLWFWDNDRRVTYLQRAGSSAFAETYRASTMERLGAWNSPELWPIPIGDGGRLLVGAETGSTTVVDTVSGRILRSLDLPSLRPRQRLVGTIASALVERPVWGRLSADPIAGDKQRLFTSSSGRWVLAGEDTGVRVHALNGTEVQLELDEHAEGVSRAVFSGDDRLVFTSGYNRALACFDLEDGGRCRWRIDDAHDDAILALAIHPDGTLLASAGEDRVIRLWDAVTGAPRGQLLGHTENVLAAAFSGSGETLVSASSRQMKSWAAEPSDTLTRVSPHGDFVESLSFSDRFGILVTTTRSGIRLWDAESGVFIASRDIAGPVQDAAILGDLLLVMSGGELVARNLFTGRVAWRQGALSLIYAESRIIILPDRDSTAVVLDSITGQPIGSLPEQWDSRQDATACGPRVAFVDQDREEVRVYDIEAQQLVETVPCAGASAAFLLNGGGTLALADADRNISVMDPGTSSRGVLRGHTGRVLSVAEMPGRRLLFSAGLDRTIRVWDLRHMEEIGELRDHMDRVTALLALPDERTVFSGSHDYTVRRWTTVPARELDRAQRSYQQEFTHLMPIAERLLSETQGVSAAVSRVSEVDELTPRQRQILRQLLLGMAWEGEL